MNNEKKYKELENLVLERNKDKSYIPRIEKELEYIKAKNSSEFFLTAFEIISELSKENEIIGPANGYANGSLINFLLGLTVINPIKYDLICEPYFNSNYTFLNLNVSDTKLISNKHLKIIKKTEIQFNTLKILKKYQEKSLKPDYKFKPNKLVKANLKVNLPNTEMFHFNIWELEKDAMEIKNENDLINSLAISNYGLKSFIISKILQNQHLLFDELVSTNKLLIFQEQWINLVSSYSGVSIDEVCSLKTLIGQGKYSLNNFIKHFPKQHEEHSLRYLFEILPFLLSKAHTVAESHIVCATLNFK